MKPTSLTDARVRKTQGRLRDSLISLIHEKDYDAIVVSDILERADVGRSAFYAHFANKHALLEDGIDQVLHSHAARHLPASLGPFGKIVSFSFPFFEYVGQCRHSTNLKTNRRGRAVVHGRLRKLLVERVQHEINATTVSLRNDSLAIPADLLAQHVVGTFVVVLNWWVDSRSMLSPREVDDLFLTLVGSVLTAAGRG